jgi:hypothetical protein
MKHSSLTGLLLTLATAFFLTSCGGGANEKTTTTDSTAIKDSIAKAEAAAKAKSTVVTTPQNMLIVTHKVANYAKWLPAFEAHDSARVANGIHSYVIGRGYPDSNMVMVALKIDDTAKAKASMKDPNVKKNMQKAGVIGQPMVSLITATWQDTATIESRLRSRTTFTVKDWDAWVKGFEEGKQERLDNGLVDRVIGHDINDNKKVSLVVAVTDTAKASAYWKSDALKKRRAASGVIGEPVRFVFRIVKRY